MEEGERKTGRGRGVRDGEMKDLEGWGVGNVGVTTRGGRGSGESREA